MRGVVAELEKTYGEMELRTGDILEYRGITIDYSEKGSVKIGAKDYILEAIEESPRMLAHSSRRLWRNTCSMWMRSVRSLMRG